MEPEVSVVMPSYNQAAYIDEAIRSVLGQAGGRPLELVVMDGGSTDGTQEILHRLADEWPGMIRWTSEKDQGPAHAINKALELVRGDIIGWLNADDRYKTGAVDRAVTALKNNTNWLMVYGHGEHIDASGCFIGDYPTRGPNLPIAAFAEGCFICQPTVFLRKEAISTLGPLDERLETAFDLEWWLRLFSRCPERVGFVDAVQAQSRLHGGCMTLGRRETVIRESIQLLSEYVGGAPLTWFRTYLDEFLSDSPLENSDGDIRGHVKTFSERIRPFLKPKEQLALDEILKGDARIQAAQQHAYLDLYPDGWLPAETTLHVRNQQGNVQYIELQGRHVLRERALKLFVRPPEGPEYTHIITRKGPFTLQIPVSGKKTCNESRNEVRRYLIRSEGTFVPSQVDPNSNDHRELACRVDGIRVHRGAAERLKALISRPWGAVRSRKNTGPFRTLRDAFCESQHSVIENLQS